MTILKDLINKLGTGRVLLVGDIMLDSFVYGGVSRISPEAPIPVLSVNRENKMLGAAGNVLANLRGLGCMADFAGIIGDDTAGNEIGRMLNDIGCDTNGLICDDHRPTTLKTRYLSQNQQLLRVDREKVEWISSSIETKILDYAAQKISQAGSMVLSDYGKGVLTPSLIKSLIKLAKKYKIPVIVDPKANDFAVYKGADIITPNRNELSKATGGMPVKSDEEIVAAANALIKHAGIENVIATRSEDGISVISKKDQPQHFETKAIEVYDVSGAGDTVVAVIGATMAAGGTIAQAAQLANIAGGLAVAKVGTAIIRTEEIINALDVAEKTPRLAPVSKWQEAQENVRKWQAQGLKVGFTNGCFDILHSGHVQYLEKARAKCDRLVVAVNHDKSVKILKGESRPINDENARATVISALSSVDMVVLFGAEKLGEDNTPCELVGFLKPDIFMKGGDYKVEQLPEGKIVKSYGGQVEIMPLYEGFSTTGIIEKSKHKAA